jgi:hypothetical protein
MGRVVAARLSAKQRTSFYEPLDGERGSCLSPAQRARGRPAKSSSLTALSELLMPARRRNLFNNSREIRDSEGAPGSEFEPESWGWACPVPQKLVGRLTRRILKNLQRRACLCHEGLSEFSTLCFKSAILPISPGLPVTSGIRLCG